MSFACVLSSAACDFPSAAAGTTIPNNNKPKGWIPHLLGAQLAPHSSLWKPDNSCYGGKDVVGTGLWRERSMKVGVICSKSSWFEDQEADSLLERLGWIDGREVSKKEGVNLTKYAVSSENSSQGMSRRDLPEKQTDSVVGLGDSVVRVESSSAAEDPPDQVKRNPLDQVQEIKQDVRDSAGTLNFPNKPFFNDISSVRQGAGRTIDTDYERYTEARTDQNNNAKGDFAGEDQLSRLGEEEGTQTREEETVRSTGGLGSWYRAGMGKEDLSIQQSKKLLLLKRSNLIAKQVVSLSNAAVLGFVSQLWVDLQILKVEVVEVKPNFLVWETDEIPLSNLHKIGDVILAKNDDLLDGDFLVPNCEAMVGSDVLTETNVYLGKVRDYSFNLEDGEIVAFEIDPLGVPFIPAKMISTYLVMVDEIVDITRDCLLLYKGAETRIQRLSKGFFQSSVIEIEMMQAANFDGTRFRGYSKGRKRMGSFKGKNNDAFTVSGTSRSSSSSRAVQSTERMTKSRPMKNRDMGDPYTDYTQDNSPGSSSAYFSPSRNPEKQ